MLAELLPRHAFVDLETTGLDPRRDEVIEVGVLLVERGQVAGRLSRLCRPSAPLPQVIKRITGICDEELSQQPPFSELLPTLRQALSGFTVVAHNAAFEQSFLKEPLEELHAPVLDTCELLHYLYPELESHSLEALVRWAGVGQHAAHRALRDCEDTLAVLSVALTRCLSEGRADQVADLVATLSPGPSPILSLLEQLLLACRGVSSAPLLEQPSPLPGPGGHPPSIPGSLCGRRALEATRTQPEMSYEERAPRAYLRAFLTRRPDGDLDRLSYWFRRRYPALGRLAMASRSEPATTLF